MRHAKDFLRRGAASLLAAAVLCAVSLAAEPEKSQAERRREDLEFLYQTVLVENHPNAFANAPESEFLALKKDIESRLETESDVEFLLDLQRLTSLVGDSHTTLSIGSAAAFRLYPFALVRRGESWHLSAVSSENEKLLCQEVTKLAGKPMAEVIDAFGTLFSSDNPIHLRRNFRQSCNVADIYEYLGLVEAGNPLAVTLKSGKTLSLAPVEMTAMDQTEFARLSDRLAKAPATAAADAYYFAKALDKRTYYIQYNTCAQDPELAGDLEALRTLGVRVVRTGLEHAAAGVREFGAKRLLVLAERGGVWLDPANEKTRLDYMDARLAQEVLESGLLDEVTQKNLRICLEPLEAGAEECALLPAREEHALLLELLCRHGHGTAVGR